MPEFVKLTTEEKDAWLKDKGKCWKCGRGHLGGELYSKETLLHLQ